MNNLTIRIISALAILPPVLALIFLAPPIGFASAAVVIAAVAGWEFGNITLGQNFPPYRFFLSGLSAVVASAVAFKDQIPMAPVIALSITTPVAMVAFMASKSEIRKAVDGSAFAVLGALYCGALFGCMSLLVSSDPNGRYWFFALLASTIFNDTLAYTFGRLFGKTLMAPVISPKKTWAGAVGGVVGAVLAFATIRAIFIPEIAWWKVPIIGICISAACQIGDLAESFIKRGFGVKDSGNIIPGHGGILDRCDALMFAAPVVLYFLLTN